jgi:hypothetical protein
LVTTAPAPTIAYLPIVTPFMIVAFIPIHTFLPKFTQDEMHLA